MKGVDSGKIHLGLHRLDKIEKDNLIPDEPYLSVLQFYLREVEGILIDSPGYEEKGVCMIFQTIFNRLNI